MKSLVGLLLGFSVALTAGAYDLVTADGKVYQNAEITKITPIGLKYVSSDGKAGWYDFRDLAPSVQKDFNYSPQAAAAFEQKLAATGGFSTDSATITGSNGNTANLTQEQIAAQQPAPDFSSYPQEAQPLDQPPQGSSVIECAGGIPASLSSINYSAGPSYWYNTYVHWAGHYYPAYYWHHWWWNHHWCYHNGHYYPWNYYHHHGVWHNGHYYPYEHGRLHGGEEWRKYDEHRDQFKEGYRHANGGRLPSEDHNVQAHEHHEHYEHHESYHHSGGGERR